MLGVEAAVPLVLGLLERMRLRVPLGLTVLSLDPVNETLGLGDAETPALFVPLTPLLVGVV
jgi:hypothetical protein